MPSWILPGRENDPVMRYKTILETSFAYSRTFNPRNIEYYWYSLWAQTLSDLVADMSNLIVVPQFPVWFVPEDDDHEDEEDGDDPEEIVRKDPDSKEMEASPRQADGDDEEEGGGGAGNVSVAFTIPEKDAEGVIVDFAIVHLKAVAQPQPKYRIRYGGWRITEANIGLLVEVKRFVSRSLTGQELHDRIHVRVAEATIDLVEQAAHLFIQDENMNSVLALAAAGPYWCSVKIYRNNVKKAMHLIRAKDPSYRPKEHPSDPKLNWNVILRVDLARSRDRLHTIYNALKEMSVLEIPAGV
ncbi:hypothetical protein DEU56DRAFT_915217 [Suillus clintonianus]|uniref:uncharacterized protein n=1 Tax=Suillus clintonianus TaxID=1904413 RepID=UPI001B87F614|nr:uncharacterized protein DEU56DRAFT_915217 [Suillus clintonianus]KAG2129093.1 hypothetical protein DEU56DRAFT_915217 [Suillus clintonianus]